MIVPVPLTVMVLLEFRPVFPQPKYNLYPLVLKVPPLTERRLDYPVKNTSPFVFTVPPVWLKMPLPPPSSLMSMPEPILRMPDPLTLTVPL